MCGSFFSRARLMLLATFLLASPASRLFGQEASAQAPPDVATMSGMQSLVPTLVAVGWDDFFLDLGQSLGLSEDQFQRLYGIRDNELSSNQELAKELEQAQLNLYQDLDSDRVSTARLDLDLQKIGELKEAAAATHFRAIIEAINVLNHDQHVQAEQWLKLRLEMLRDRNRDRNFTVEDRSDRKSWKKSEYHWSSAFTPQQLGWRAW